jgi:hypothetical protein
MTSVIQNQTRVIEQLSRNRRQEGLNTHKKPLLIKNTSIFSKKNISKEKTIAKYFVYCFWGTRAAIIARAPTAGSRHRSSPAATAGASAASSRRTAPPTHQPLQAGGGNAGTGRRLRPPRCCRTARSDKIK